MNVEKERCSALEGNKTPSKERKGMFALDLGSENCTHSPVVTRCAMVMAGADVGGELSEDEKSKSNPTRPRPDDHKNVVERD